MTTLKPMTPYRWLKRGDATAEPWPLRPAQAEALETDLATLGWVVRTMDTNGSQGLVREVYWHRTSGVRGDLRVTAEWAIERAPLEARYYADGSVRRLTVGRWALTHSPLWVYHRHPDCEPETYGRLLHPYNQAKRPVYDTSGPVRSLADLRRLIALDNDTILRLLLVHGGSA